MILSTNQDPRKLGMKILLAHSECANDCAAGRLVRKLREQLEGKRRGRADGADRL